MNRHLYYMNCAYSVADASPCSRHKVGAVIVSQDRIIATGFNGPPRGYTHDMCFPTCIKDRHGIASGHGHDVCPAVHAEMNAIINAAAVGVPVSMAMMYCTHQPCTLCQRLIVNSGIKFVAFSLPYSSSLDMLKDCGVFYEHIPGGLNENKRTCSCGGYCRTREVADSVLQGRGE